MVGKEQKFSHTHDENALSRNNDACSEANAGRLAGIDAGSVQLIEGRS